jgi:hypothetical protein
MQLRRMVVLSHPASRSCDRRSPIVRTRSSQVVCTASSASLWFSRKPPAIALSNPS